jgi:hypothetical protein
VVNYFWPRRLRNETRFKPPYTGRPGVTVRGHIAVRNSDNYPISYINLATTRHATELGFAVSLPGLPCAI